MAIEKAFNGHFLIFLFNVKQFKHFFKKTK